MACYSSGRSTEAEKEAAKDLKACATEGQVQVQIAWGEPAATTKAAAEQLAEALPLKGAPVGTRPPHRAWGRHQGRSDMANQRGKGQQEDSEDETHKQESRESFHLQEGGRDSSSCFPPFCSSCFVCLRSNRYEQQEANADKENAAMVCQVGLWDDQQAKGPHSSSAGKGRCNSSSSEVAHRSLERTAKREAEDEQSRREEAHQWHSSQHQGQEGPRRCCGTAPMEQPVVPR